MLPETVGAFIAFLGLVAPGVVFELLREQRRPAISESAFREASRVALVSLCFTVFALTVLSVVFAATDGRFLPDLGEWLLTGDAYVKAHYGKILAGGILEILLACGGAYVLDAILVGRSTGRITAVPIWFYLFRHTRPAETTPWLHIKLADDTEFRGYLDAYAPDAELANREISLRGPKLEMKTSDGAWAMLDNWASVCVRGDQIAWMRTTYVHRQTGAVVKPPASAP